MYVCEQKEKYADLVLLHAGHELVSDSISSILSFFQSQPARIKPV